MQKPVTYCILRWKSITIWYWHSFSLVYPRKHIAFHVNVRWQLQCNIHFCIQQHRQNYNIANGSTVFTTCIHYVYVDIYSAIRLNISLTERQQNNKEQTAYKLLLTTWTKHFKRKKLKKFSKPTSSRSLSEWVLWLSQNFYYSLHHVHCAITRGPWTFMIQDGRLFNST